MHPIDAAYGAILRDNLPEVLSTLVPNNAARTKAAFLADTTISPHFLYTASLGAYPIEEKYHSLLELQRQLLWQRTSHDLRGLYAGKIAEGLLRTYLLEAARKGDDQGFSKISRKIYGTPSQLALATTLGQLDNYLTVSTTHSTCTDALRRIVARSHLTPIDPATLMCRLDLPPKSDCAHEPVISHSKAVELIATRLENGDAPGWGHEVDETGTRTGLMASTLRRLILIPGKAAWDQRPRRQTAVHAIVEHELTHARRAANGARLCTPLELGLGGNFEAEEAAATWVESTITGADDFPGFLYTLAIGLASGLIDGKQRVFHEVYALVKAAAMLERQAEEPGEMVENIRRYATNRAYVVTFRTFRGTSGQTPGACNFKDSIYRNGAVRLWPLISTNEWVQHTLFKGEFDPSKRDHTEPLIRLGWLSAN